MTLAFFRRHRKAFMVLMFAAVISMVFFLSWRAMFRKLAVWFSETGPRRVVGTIAGRTVRAEELADLYQSVKAAGQASQWWAVVLDSSEASPERRQRVYGYTLGMTAWPILSQTLKGERAQSDTILAWLALYEEARRLGFDASEAQVAARIESLKGLGLTDRQFARVADEVADGQRGFLMEALRKDLTLVAYINWLTETLGAAVEAEMRREFTRMDERIKVRLVVLKAEDVLDQVQDVPEDALETQFGKYRTFLPGKSPEGYGYRIPDKVAIEYLVADPAGFEEAAEPQVTDQDVRAYYDANKDPEFLVEDEKDEKPDADDKAGDQADDKADDKAGNDAADETGDDAPSSDSNDGEGKTDDKQQEPTEPTFRPFEEVRADIRKTLIRREAERLAAQRLYENVAEIRTMRTKPDLGIWADGKAVRHVVVEGLHTEQDLARLDGIGQATRQDDALPTQAVAVVELVGQDKGRIAVGEISDVFTGLDGQAYAFRVTAVEANHEPATLSEVRDQVLADVRRAKAFGLIRERGKALLETASAKKSLEAAAKQVGLETVETDLFPRERAVPYGGRWMTFPPSLPKVGSSRLVVAECFRMAEGGRRRTLVTVAGRQMVVAAELIDRKPPREAAFETMRPLVAQRVASRLAQNAVRNVLATNAVRRRMTVVAEQTQASAERRETDDDPGL